MLDNLIRIEKIRNVVLQNDAEGTMTAHAGNACIFFFTETENKKDDYNNHHMERMEIFRAYIDGLENVRRTGDIEETEKCNAKPIE